MSYCKFCNANIQYLQTEKGKLIRVDAETIGPNELYTLNAGGEVKFEPKRHRTHNCPDAERLRKAENGAGEKKGSTKIPMDAGHESGENLERKGL